VPLRRGTMRMQVSSARLTVFPHSRTTGCHLPGHDSRNEKGGEGPEPGIEPSKPSHGTARGRNGIDDVPSRNVYENKRAVTSDERQTRDRPNANT